LEWANYFLVTSYASARRHILPAMSSQHFLIMQLQTKMSKNLIKIVKVDFARAAAKDTTTRTTNSQQLEPELHLKEA